MRARACVSQPPHFCSNQSQHLTEDLDLRERHSKTFLARPLTAFAHTFVNCSFIIQTIKPPCIGMSAAPGAAVSKMQSFFDTCSPEQIGELMQVLQATQEKNSAGGARDAASTMAVKARVTAKRTGKKQRNKKAKLERAQGSMKRPLNSWMAYRSR